MYPHKPSHSSLAKLISLSLLIITLSFLAACSSSTTTPKIPALSLDKTTATVTVGDADITFTATLENSSESISWSLAGAGSISSTTGVSTRYTPPASGSAGSATLTASAGSLTAVAVITINGETVNAGPSLSISPKELTVTVGDTDTTVFSATAANLTEPITWTLAGAGQGEIFPIDDVSVRYTPPASGEAGTVILTASSGTVQDSATITIKAKATDTTPSLTLSPKELTVTVGDTDTTVFTATVANLTEPVTWTLAGSGQGEIFPIDDLNVRYTPPATGSAGSVTLFASSGTLQDSATITINAAPETLPVINSVSVQNNNGSKQVRQNAGNISLEVTGERLDNMTIVRLGSIAGSPSGSNSGSAILNFTIPAGASIGQQTLSVTTANGETSVSNAVEITPITAAPTGSDTTGTGTSDAPYRSITKAVSVAGNADSVELKDGSYSPATGEVFPLILSTDLTLRGNGANSTNIIGADTTNTECFIVSSGASNLSDFNVNNCFVGIGVKESASVTVNNVNLNANTFGLAAVDTATLMANNVQSTSSLNSGILADDNTNITINNSSFQSTENNFFLPDVSGVGAAFDGNSVAVISDSVFSGNTTDGLRALGNSNVTVSTSVFRDNQIDGLGMCCDAPLVTVSDSTFVMNAEDGVNVFGGTLMMSDSTISSNGVSGINNDLIDFDNSVITLNNITINDAHQTGIVMNLNGSASTVVTMNDSVVTASVGKGISANIRDNATSDLRLKGSDITNNSAEGITYSGYDSANLALIVQGGSISQNSRTGIYTSGDASSNQSFLLGENPDDNSRLSISNNGNDGLYFASANSSIEVKNTDILNNNINGVFLFADASSINFGTQTSPGNNVISGNGDTITEEFYDARSLTSTVIELVGTQLGTSSSNTCGASIITGAPGGTTKTDTIGTDGALYYLPQGNQMRCSLP